MNILEKIWYFYAVVGTIDTLACSLVIENNLTENNIKGAMVYLGLTAVLFAATAYSFSQGLNETFGRNKEGNLPKLLSK